MARKIAHEVKNPLTPIAVSVADLKRSFDQQRPDFPEILDRAARTVDEEVRSLKRLLQEFADFGRLPPPTFAPVRVSELVADLEALYGHEVAAGRLSFTTDGGQVTLRADRAQLKQALVNLIKNGLEAVDGDGRVAVSARADRDAVEIDVSDTGPGLPEAQRERPFAPDVTTKPGGSGLGLAMVERIAIDHRGRVTAESAPGRGTTVRLRLPVVREV
jgi:nitrogen fixation/metabolism regulation signal transduction histidine kinase